MKAIDFPFRIDPNGGLALTPDYNHVVRAQVIDAIMTNMGERVMRPRYGCDFQSALFDPTDELIRKDAASMVKQRLSNLVTRAIVRSVTVEIASEQTKTVFHETSPSMIIVTVVYRAALYATDTVLAVPVASEFIARQQAIASGFISANAIG